MNFLSARWEYLVMANYKVPLSLLHPYLPPFTEVDTWEGQGVISLIGFLFNDVKVLGVSWPYHRDFEEVNLRFYIKRFDGTAWRRGVAFVSEIVPRPFIAIIANRLYNEHYTSMPMSHNLHIAAEGITVDYRWKYKDSWNSLSLKSEANPRMISPSSEESFIFEHYYGYNQLNEKTTIEYSLSHPSWQTYAVKDFNLDCDGARLYGPAFGEILRNEPDSIFFALGSPVTVQFPKKIRANYSRNLSLFL